MSQVAYTRRAFPDSCDNYGSIGVAWTTSDYCGESASRRCYTLCVDPTHAIARSIFCCNSTSVIPVWYENNDDSCTGPLYTYAQSSQHCYEQGDGQWTLCSQSAVENYNLNTKVHYAWTSDTCTAPPPSAGLPAPPPSLPSPPPSPCWYIEGRTEATDCGSLNSILCESRYVIQDGELSRWKPCVLNQDGSCAREDTDDAAFFNCYPSPPAPPSPSPAPPAPPSPPGSEGWSLDGLTITIIVVTGAVLLGGAMLILILRNVDDDSTRNCVSLLNALRHLIRRDSHNETENKTTTTAAPPPQIVVLERPPAKSVRMIESGVQRSR